MRKSEEIIEAIDNKGIFLKSDMYKAGLVELYPFIPFDKIPKMHANQMIKDHPNIVNEWDPEEERNNWDFKESFNDEVSFLRRVIKENEINAAIFRTPRLLALVWLEGYYVKSYDKALYEIIIRKPEINTAKKKLLSLYKRIEKDLNL